MKILHINSYFNGSYFYKNLYDEQIKTGTKIDVFVPVSSSYQEQGKELGSYTKISVNHRRFERFLFYLKHKKIYQDILKKFKFGDYSVIHAHSLFSNGYIAWKLKKNFNIPYIVAVRNTDLNVFFGKMPHLRKLGIEIIKDAEKVVFLSSSYKEITIQKYITKNIKKEIFEKSLVIPNGVDEYWINNIGKAKKMKNRKTLRILYVGVVDRNKNLLKSVEALQLLGEKGYDIQFTVVGKIKDKGIFKQLNSCSFVNYIPPKNKEELRKIYLVNDIFLMPSIKETFGLVYVEAMSQGLPVIYSKNQGFDKQFEDGEIGFAVDCCNASDISVKITKILDNYEEISRLCILKCEKFNWKDISQIYFNIYSKIDKSNNAKKRKINS